MTTDPLWIPATIAAAAFQVGRNALQRGLAGSAGPWGATLVRFLFGLPFSACLALAALTLCPRASPRFCAAFWLAAAAGGASQVLATAALLSAMRRSGFAIGTALQQSSLPLAALIGLLAFGDHLSAPAWIGVAVTTAGLFGLGWPARPEHRPHAAAGAAFGVLSGLLFGFSLNAFRHAALALDGRQPVFAAILTLFVVQAMQTLVLTGVLLLRDPGIRPTRTAWASGLLTP